MNIIEWLADVEYSVVDTVNLTSIEINGLALDSRAVKPGNVFIALSGSRQHGLVHVQQAILKGAVAVIYEPKGLEAFVETPALDVVCIAVQGLAQQLGLLAARFYRQPSKELSVIGITGTNGKTSCSQFLGQLLDDCGVIGTLGWGVVGELQQTVNTTPDAISLQQVLAHFVTANKRYVAMEVSSHGLVQGRVEGIEFKGAVFTNISRDHLDYHQTMAAYIEAKLSLLTKPGLEFVVVNLDDAESAKVCEMIPKNAQLWGVSRYGKRVEQAESVIATDVKALAQGFAMTVVWRTQQEELVVPLYGDFNVDNALLVLAVLLALGVDLHDAAERLTRLQPIAGRMEAYIFPNFPSVFIDYAHTPDALATVLSGVRQHCQQQLWVVFGCGGNRDKGKRPLMRREAERWADRIIITDDNPRDENSADIIQDILSDTSVDNIVVIPDRASAIRYAINHAQINDSIVVAGKGHEDYQEIKGIRYPFSDKKTVLAALNQQIIKGVC